MEWNQSTVSFAYKLEELKLIEALRNLRKFILEKGHKKYLARYFKMVPLAGAILPLTKGHLELGG